MRKILTAAMLLFLSAAPALADSIACTVTQTGFSNLVKTYPLSTAEINRMIAAYQSDANVSVNGTATRVQVLNYIVTLWYQEAQGKVKSMELQSQINAIVPTTPLPSP